MPLLPWAPGFQRVASDRAVVFYHPAERAAALGVARRLAAVVAGAESFHGLRFRFPPEVFLPDSEAEYRRLTGGVARFRALPVRGRVFLSPRARRQSARGEIHLDTYLRHELSHALLYQHLGWSGLLGLAPWFEEGLATLSAQQMGVDGYFDRPRVLAWWRLGRAVPPSQYASRFEDSPAVAALPDDRRFLFLFAQYAILVDELVVVGGRPRFQDLLDRVLRGEDLNDAFRAEYGRTPDDFFRDLVARSAHAT